jgi:hypothetical protein
VQQKIVTKYNWTWFSFIFYKSESNVNGKVEIHYFCCMFHLHFHSSRENRISLYFVSSCWNYHQIERMRGRDILFWILKYLLLFFFIVHDNNFCLASCQFPNRIQILHDNIFKNFSPSTSWFGTMERWMIYNRIQFRKSEAVCELEIKTKMACWIIFMLKLPLLPFLISA